MSGEESSDVVEKQNNQFAHPKHGGAFSRFGFAVGRVAPCRGGTGSPDSTRATSKTNFRTSPIPNLMLGACSRMRGYSSSAVDEALSSSSRRKYTDETASSSYRHESSCCTEPPLSRSNSLINPVALTLLHQVIDDDENDSTMKTSRSPSPEAMNTSIDDGNDSGVQIMLQAVDEAPPSVHADPPSCRRPRAIRPS